MKLRSARSWTACAKSPLPSNRPSQPIIGCCEPSEVRKQGREGASLALRLQQLAGSLQLLEGDSFDLVGGGPGGGQLGGSVRGSQQQALQRLVLGRVVQRRLQQVRNLQVEQVAGGPARPACSTPAPPWGRRRWQNAARTGG